MALDKLGNPTLQKQGNKSSNQTHDTTTHLLLEAVLEELTHIRICIAEMSGITLDSAEIQDEIMER